MNKYRNSIGICFSVSLNVSMSLSPSASPSLENCLCAVVVDLEACREPSKDVVALSGHETVLAFPSVS